MHSKGTSINGNGHKGAFGIDFFNGQSRQDVHHHHTNPPKCRANRIGPLFASEFYHMPYASPCVYNLRYQQLGVLLFCERHDLLYKAYL